MTSRAWLRPAWLLGRRVGIVLLWVLLVAGIAVGVNVVGLHVVGSIDGWEQWLREHSGHFLVWRLLLYAATAYGWWWMRRRLREPISACCASRSRPSPPSCCSKAASYCAMAEPRRTP